MIRDENATPLCPNAGTSDGFRGGLAPSGYHIFPKMKQHLGEMQLNIKDIVKDAQSIGGKSDCIETPIIWINSISFKFENKGKS